MTTRYKVEFNEISEIFKKRGMLPGGNILKKLSSEIVRYSDPYTPFKTGYLKNSSYHIAEDGSYIEYDALYARYQYEGDYKNYSNNTNGLRGPHWIERMWFDNKETICKEVEEWIK